MYWRHLNHIGPNTIRVTNNIVYYQIQSEAQFSISGTWFGKKKSITLSTCSIYKMDTGSYIWYISVLILKKRKHNSQGILDVNKIMILTCIVILFLEFAWAKHKIGKWYILSRQKMLNYLSRILIILIVEIIVWSRLVYHY